MSSPTLLIGRLELGRPTNMFVETLGDPVGATGGAVTAAPRVPLQVTVDINTILDGAATLDDAQVVRRKLRSLLNNTVLKMQACFMYVQFAEDTEQSGWLIPSPMAIQSADSVAWKAVGLWQTSGGQWFLAGRRRSMREGRLVWMKDLRLGRNERDVLGWLVSTDFNYLPANPLTPLPSGATAIINGSTDQVPTVFSMPAGRDGGQCKVAVGTVDLAALSFNRSEAAMNLSDVIVYDRRGFQGPFGSGTLYDSSDGLVDPESAYSWQEVLGDDWPWSWLKVGGTADCPVMENGLVRVRWDGSSTPGFRVDVWNGSAYVEQGKMIFARITQDSYGTNLEDTWVASSLREWTPDRGIIETVVSASGDPYSYERIFITMKRGEIGLTFDTYVAPSKAGLASDVRCIWVPALTAGLADFNQSVLKIDSNVVPPAPAAGAQNAGPSPGVFASTAGTGAGPGNSGLFPGGETILGAGNFSASENWVSILRCQTGYKTAGPYQHNLAVLQGLARYSYLSTASAYVIPANTHQIAGTNWLGYVQAQLFFTPTVGSQIVEAEDVKSSSGTATIVADGGASGGQTVQETQGAATNPTLQFASNLFGTYRFFARVKVDAGKTGHFVLGWGTGSTSPVTSTSTSYIWIDLGEGILDVADPIISMPCYVTGGGSLYLDRVEAHKLQDLSFMGARDVGQAALMDSRTIGMLVTR